MELLSGITVRGSGFVHTLDYLDRTHGAQVTRAILERMPPEARRNARRALATGMYPVEHVSELLAAIRAELAPQDPEINFKVSLAVAKNAFSTLYKVFFKLGRPHFIIKRAAKVWDRMASQGALEVTHQDRGLVGLRLTDFNYADPEFCAQRLRAWYQAPLELSGCRITLSEHPACRSRGDRLCEWQYRWEV